MSFTYQDTPDKCYYDIVVSNISSTDQEPPVLYFNETRNNPFILDPESYYLSIIRFTLDTNTLPVIVPEIQPRQANKDLTIYSLTLSWVNPLDPSQQYNKQVFVDYSPQNLGAQVPSPPSQTTSGLQNNYTGYYDIYSYQYWLLLVNNTFQTAFNQLKSAVEADGLTLPTTYAPELSWDTQQNIAILSADNAGYDYTQDSNIKIYFNSSMYGLFSSLPAIILSLSTQPFGKNVRINTSSFGGANIVPYPPTSPTYQALQIVQEYSTVSNWTPIVSVVFTSNTLPIVSNQLSAPLLFYNGNRFVSSGNNSNIARVITDFVSNDGVYKPNIVYAPTAQYRLVNLVGNQPLYNLDVEVFYKNRVGELIPFRLGAGCSATIKILFTRKDTETMK